MKKNVISNLARVMLFLFFLIGAAELTPTKAASRTFFSIDYYFLWWKVGNNTGCWDRSGDCLDDVIIEG